MVLVILIGFVCFKAYSGFTMICLLAAWLVFSK